MTTLLAVDDSLTMRRVLEITFAGEDFDTVLASNAQEALQRLHESQPPIALVDITLGDESGYDLCQKIKGEAPGTRVLLLSSKQNPYDAARGAAVGADDHLDKPFDTQALIDKVQALSSQPAAPPPKPMTAEPAPAAPPPKPMSAEPAAPMPAPPPPVAAPPAPQPMHAEPPAPPPMAAEPPAPPPVQPVQAQPTPQPSSPPPRPAAIPPKREAPAAQPPLSVEQPGPVSASSTASNGASFESQLAELGLTAEQVQGVLALSKEVVEQAVWEVVPALAETLIREEIERLTKE